MMGLWGFADGAYGSFWVIYLTSVAGFTLSQIGLFQLLFFYSLAFLDFPLGGFADRYGRRFTLRIGYLLMAVGYYLLLLASIPTIFTAGLLLGASNALVTGTLEAWIVDALGTREEATLGKVFGRGEAIHTAGMLIAGPVGMLLVAIGGLQAVFSAVLAAAVGKLLVTVIMVENYGGKAASYVDTLREGLRLVGGSRLLQTYLVASLLSGTWASHFLLLWQPVLVDLGLGKAYLGPVYTLLLATMSVSSYLSGRVMGRLKPSTVLALASAVSSACLALLAVGPRHLLAYMALFAGLEASLGLSLPAGAVWRNAHLPSEVRATVLSLFSTASSLAIGAYYCVAGLLAERIGMHTSFLVPLALAATSALLYYSLSLRNPYLESREPT